MEEEGRGLFDASVYMLFEATGDSEAVYFDAALEHEYDAAEDDAQSSCSYGSICDSTERLHEVVDGGDDILRGVEFNYCSGDEDEGGDEDDDGVVDQRRCRFRAEPGKSKGREESNVNMMNEREGDKLFWEACLAS